MHELTQLVQIRDWAMANEQVRAAILVGSRTDPEAKVDVLSDYDVNLYVKSLAPFWQDDDWLAAFGEILVRCPWRPGSFRDGWLTRMAIFKPGMRIDFQISEDVPTIDMHINGFEVIVDKENLIHNWPAPTFADYFVKRPSAEEFGKFTNEFWWDAVYVAKSLRRDELFYAKYMLDSELRFTYLQRVIEWGLAVDHNWSIRPNKFGRKFKALLASAEWQRIESTFAGASIEENWQALFNTLTIFRRLAQKVGDDLGFDYPETLDAEVTEYIQRIKTLPK